MKKKDFIAAITQMETEKGFSREALLDALNESFRVTFAKKVEDEYRFDKRAVKSVQKVDKTLPKLPDALIRTDIDLDKAKIRCFHQWLVVPEDEVEDDYIQIGLEDAKEKNPKLNVGDYYEEEFNIEDLGPKDVSRFMSCFRQKLAKEEKDNLLKNFANKIGTIITGTVEKCDEHNVIVNLLGKTSTTMTRRDLIGDEKFKVGEPIKVYVVGIGKDKDDKKNGSLIQVSRSCDGYLQQLFESEVHEIYDGTVVIKGVARIPGKRSKICVYSNDPNVDASGACIGQSGNRIQAVVSQLGNGKDSKEKVDVVTYSPNLGLYVAELLKPGKVLGMNIDEENKEIQVVCEDDTQILAIGHKGVNVILARKLTGYNIKVYSETDAKNEGITYKPMADFEVEAREEERKRFRERQEEINKAREAIRNKANEIASEETKEEVSEEPVEEKEPEVTPTATKVEEAKPVEKAEKVEEATPVVEVKPKKVEEPIETAEVKTTTTLESLEKSLEEEKKEKESSKKQFKKKKKENKKSEEKSEVKTIRKMEIYTDEELEELDNEDDIDEYDDEDYSDYDDDDYYEDK